MERIPLIILETDQFHNQIKKVALVTARNIADEGITAENVEKFYITSGLQLLFRTLINDGIIRDHIDAMFIESSTLISTIEGNKLDAFTLIWQGKEEDDKIVNRSSFLNNVEKNFKNIVTELRSNHEAIYNHPSFFIKPKKVETYISYFDKGLETLNQQAELSPRLDASRKLAIKLHAKYTQASIDRHRKYTQLHKVFDSLKKRDVYVSSSGLTGAGMNYYEMKSPELLVKYLRKARDPFTLHLLNHGLYDQFFNSEQDGLSNSKRTVFISLPLLGSKAQLENNFKNFSNAKYDGLGALFIYFQLRDENSKYPERKVALTDEDKKRESFLFKETLPVFFERLEHYCKMIPTLIKDFTHGYTFHISEKLRKDIERHATKSAIAAVMSRNMSHNIGSHVLSKLANLDYDSVKKLLDEKFASPSYWINQNKIFYGYLQKRMEFIADISTAEAIITNASLFQKEILNKFKTVGKSNDYPHFISDFISGVDGVNNKSLKVRGYYIDDTGCFDLEEHPEKDILIDLPNDTLGSHALYVMLENIIRNASKHNKITDNLELKLFIQNSEKTPGYYEILIVDNQQKTHEAKYKKNKTKYDLPQIINKIIKNPILDNGKVRESAWGILELKICAAYLAKQRLEELDTASVNNLPLIQAAFFDDNGLIQKDYQKFNFGFKFWLRKPKLVMIATENVLDYIHIENNRDDELNLERELNNKGVYISGKENINDLIINGTEHEYLVLIQKKSENLSVPRLGNECSNQKVIVIDENEDISFRDFIKSNANSHNAIREYLIKKFVVDYSPIDITSQFVGIINHDENRAAAEQRPIKQVPTLVIESSIGNIVFDQHEGARSDGNLPAKYEYWEYCGSQSGTAEILSAAKEKAAFLNDVIHSTLAKVIIIDERIQENTSEIDKQNFKEANIFIPTAKEFNLMEQSFDSQKLEKMVRTYLSLSPEYLIIHLGVIEKLLNATTKEEIMIWINEKFKINTEVKEKSIEERTKLIIISGRGKPPTLPNRSLYLPYSLVAQCILPANQSSKLKLTQLLNKARRYE